MILEVVILNVRPGEEERFESAFHRAALFLANMPGFRGSPQYQEWKSLLHHFYDPFPTVEHYSAPLPA